MLRDVDVDIAAGTHVAVVGETGSGKTTFAKLLCRLADPSGGLLSVGGVDLRRVAPEARRAAIRLVPQDGFLFDTTVGANVAMGRPGATLADGVPPSSASAWRTGSRPCPRASTPRWVTR